MESWYKLSLGDGITAAEPAAEIAAYFNKEFTQAGSPLDWAVYIRLESEGRLYCEVIAYFSPAARDVADAFNARPCLRPSRGGLDLLAGKLESFQTLFGGSPLTVL